MQVFVSDTDRLNSNYDLRTLNLSGLVASGSLGRFVCGRYHSLFGTNRLLKQVEWRVVVPLRGRVQHQKVPFDVGVGLGRQ